jgi:hypothetical protein
MNRTTILNTRRQLLLGSLALAAAAPAMAQTAAASLEGRSFDGVFLERGKTRGDADTITFQGGRFRSSACDRYEYSDAPYKTTMVGDAIAFETETVSPKYGKLLWKGYVRGDKLDATATMVRDGKPPIENWIVAGAKK